MTETVKGVFTADVSGYTSAMSRMQKSTSSTTSGIMGGNKKNSGSMLKLGAVAGVATALVNKGMRLVADSVGGAVDRFDTLNKYPTVMRALGYSAGDTNKSIKMLNKGIDGLPTSLDEITRSAQDFAPLTGGATSGAKAALALNDAFLASGASVADASRGMTQYSQMLATGKVDLMSYRTLQETMPIALRKVANSFGYTGKSAEQDLFQALKKGKLTVDDLNKKFIELDKGQNGFAQLARKNSVGIKTSFANIKTSIVKGLANMLTAIDTGLAKAKLPGIAQMFNNMKTSINKAFDSINKIIVKAIPIIVDGFNKLVDFAKKNADWLKPLTLGIGTFIATFNGMQKVIGVVTKVGGAFKNFFSILSANPIVATIAIIAALTAGLVYFFTQTKTGQKWWSALVKTFSGSTGAIIATGAAIAILAGGLVFLIKKIMTPAKPLQQLGKHFGNTGKAAGKTAGQIAAVGVKAAGIGLGIGLAAVGLGVFAISIGQMAKSGKAGVIALGAMTASIALLAGVFALFGQKLNAGVVGMLAFAATTAIISLAVTAMATAFTSFQSVGGNSVALILSLTAGVSLMAVAFGLVGPMLTSGALGMLAFGAAIVLVSAGMALIVTSLTSLANAGVNVNATIIILSVSLIAVVAVLALLGPLLTAGAIGFLALGAGVLMAGAGIALAATAIATLVNAIANLVKVVTTAMTSIITAFTGGKTSSISFSSVAAGAFRGLGAVGSAIFSALRNTVTNAMNSLSAVGKAAATSLANVAKSVWQGLKGAASGIWNGIKSTVTNAMNGARSALTSAVNGMRSAATSAWNGIKSVASTVVSSVKSIFSGLSSIDLSAAGSAIMNSFKGGLTSAFEGVKSFVSGIAGWIKKHKGPISYDRKLLIPAGNSIMTGFNAGLSSQFLNVQKNVASMADKVAKQVATGLSDISADSMDDLNASMSPSLAMSRNVDEQFSGSFDDSGLARMARMIVQAIDEKDTDLILDGDSVVKKTSGRMDNELGNNVRLRSRLT